MFHILWIVLMIVAMMGTIVFASDTLSQSLTSKMDTLRWVNYNDNHRFGKNSNTAKRKQCKYTKKKYLSHKMGDMEKQLGPCFWNTIKVEKYQITGKYKIRIAEADPKYLHSMNYVFPHINSIIQEQKATNDPVFKMKPPVPKKFEP